MNPARRRLTLLVLLLSWGPQAAVVDAPATPGAHSVIPQRAATLAAFPAMAPDYNRADLAPLVPLVPGNDDGMIALDETRITDGEDHIRVHAWHKEILHHPATLAAVERFAQGGLCDAAASAS